MAVHSMIYFQLRKRKLPKSPPDRKLLINSRAVVLTTSMFSKEDINKGTASQTETQVPASTTNAKTLRSKHKAKKSPSNTKAQIASSKSGTEESWYCDACTEDVMKDIRICIACATYYHEECVALAKDDKDNFVCPKCESVPK